MKELNRIQTELKAPKGNTNDFAGFAYRSLEDILAAVKPLLKETKTTITFEDDIVCIGGKNYVKSICYLKNDAGEVEKSVAFAREDEERKGMSASQVTGTASSYSRKYAICSLLAIDGEKDPDSLDNSDMTVNKTVKDTEKVQMSQSKQEVLKNFCSEKKAEEGVDVPDLVRFYEWYIKRAENWDGPFKPDVLYNKWCQTKRG